MKLISIVGTRPQFIKIASMFMEKIDIVHKVIHTGQHYDFNMDKVFFEELSLPKIDYHLGIGSASNVYQTCKIAEKLEEILLDEKPDWVLVYGDTNSTLGGALCASKLGIKVAHVEAGLRSYNKKMQEEINRVLVDHISSALFCPTRNSKNNLHKEGIKKNVFIVGDLMLELIHKLDSKLNMANSCLKDYILFTLHRAENVDDINVLKKILSILREVSKKICKIIFPIHPRTLRRIKENGLEGLLDSIEIIEPVSFLEMLKLEKNSKIIITDSGGVQKEALYFGIPCITLRNETEWIETLKAKSNFLVPPTSRDFENKLINTVKFLIDTKVKKNFYFLKKYFKYKNVARKIYKIILNL